MNGDFGLELRPVPQLSRSDAPEIVLQVSPTSRGSSVLLVRRVPAVLAGVGESKVARHVAGRLDRGVVDRLEDLEVELARFGRVERETESHEGVGESLDSDADGAVAHVGVLGLLDGVVVYVDDAVEVERDDLERTSEKSLPTNADKDEP